MTNQDTALANFKSNENPATESWQTKPLLGRTNL